jgi:hypothetical protein
MSNQSLSKVASLAAIVGLSALSACNGSATANDVGNADSGTSEAATDGSAIDAPSIDDAMSTDTSTPDVPIVDAGSLGMCEITSAVADHTMTMGTMGWAAHNRENGMLMYGCDTGAAAADCLSSVPEIDDTNIGATRSALTGQHLRHLYASTNASAYWTRISPDGRFVARGTHLHDLQRSAEVEAGPTAEYDPAFFPDNSRFMYQPYGRTCPLSVLTTGMPTNVTFHEIGCSMSTVGLYEHLGVSLDGSDYWATSAGAAAWDDGGHMPTTSDPPPNDPWDANAKTTLTLMANTGTVFTNIAQVRLPTPYQGDGVISPSGTLLMTRVADVSGMNPLGYRLHRLNTSRAGSAVMASLTPIANYCTIGAKPAFSLDERWVVFHHYVVDSDATELGFTGPTDPMFAAYRTQGASNVYIMDLATGMRTRLTNMAPGQYALYPAFRSDGWIYFNVRTLGTSVEHVIASDAALVLR